MAEERVFIVQVMIEKESRHAWEIEVLEIEFKIDLANLGSYLYRAKRLGD